MCLVARVEAGLWLEPSIMYIYYIISFSLFPFFTCYKNVLVNIHVQISVRCIFSSHTNSVFNILTNKQEALLLHILSKNWWSFQCLHILPNTCYGLFHSLYHFIAYIHTCVCVCVCVCSYKESDILGLTYIILMIKSFEHAFMCSSDIWVSSLKTCLIWPFAHFLTKLSVFLYWRERRSHWTQGDMSWS